MRKKAKRFKFSRRSIFFLVSIFIVVVVLVTGIIMFSTRGREVEETLVPLPYSVDSAHFALGDNIVYSDGEFLTCIGISMDIKWQFNLFADDLLFEVSESNIAAYGRDVIHVIDKNGGYLFSTQIDGDIQSVRICANKTAVYVTQQLKDEKFSYIVIFDFSGQSLHKIDITNKYMLDYGFDSDSDELFVLELDASGAAPISRISTYRAETQRMTGFMEMKDQLIESVFIIGDVTYAAGTNRLTMHSSLSDINQQILIYGWILEDTRTSDTPKFIYVPSNSGAYYDIARVIDSSGNETVINLPPGVFSILQYEDRIYCFASQDIFVYTVDGNYLRTYTMPFGIDSMEEAMPGYVFVTNDDAVYLLPLP